MKTEVAKMDKLTMRGLSPPPARIYIIIFSIAAFLMVPAGIMMVIDILDKAGYMRMWPLYVLLAPVLYDVIVLRGRYGSRWTHALIGATPAIKLMKRDAAILQAGREEVCRTLTLKDLDNCDQYSRWNALISKETVEAVRVQLKRGTLMAYMKNPVNLKATADLTFQIYTTQLLIHAP